MSPAAIVSAPVVAEPLVCRLGAIHRELPDTERDALDFMLANPQRWPARELTRILRQEGHVVGRTVVQEHRAKACRCEPR